MVLKIQISPQYQREGKIPVLIIKVNSPAHFVVKESPCKNISSEAKKFIEAEDMLQKYYDSVEEPFFQLPLKDTIVVVLSGKKFYRAKVCSILNVTGGYMFKVYLLDYGREATVPRNHVYEIQPDFLKHPFQAADFKLLNIEPYTMKLHPVDMSIAYGPVETWDISAVDHINNLHKGMSDSYIIVKEMRDNCLFGSLHMMFQDGKDICITEELLSKKFACQKTDSLDHELQQANAGGAGASISSLPVSTPEKITGSHYLNKIKKLKEKSPAQKPILGASQNDDQMLTGRFPTRLSTTTQPVIEMCLGSTVCPIQDAGSRVYDTEKSNICSSSPKDHIKSPVASNLLNDCSPKMQRNNEQDENEVKSKESQKETVITGARYLQKIKRMKDKLPAQKTVSDASLGIEQTSTVHSPSAIDIHIYPVKDASPSCDTVKSDACTVSSKDQSKSPVTSSSVKGISHKLQLNEQDGSEVNSKESYKDTAITGAQYLKRLKHLNKKSPEQKLKASLDIEETITLHSQSNLLNTSLDTRAIDTKESSKDQITSPLTSNLVLNDVVDPNYQENQKSNFLQENSTDTSVVSPQKTGCKGVKSYLSRRKKIFAGDSKVPNTESSDEASNIQNPQVAPDGSTGSKVHLNELCEEKYLNTNSEDSALEKLMDDLDKDDLLLCAMDPNHNDSKVALSSDQSGSRKSSLGSITEVQQQFKLLDFSDKSLWEKQRVPALCIGDAVPKPLLSVIDAAFPSALQKTLERLNFCGPSCIQSVVWPSVARNRCLAAIGPPRSGKTIAYLLPIVANFLSDVTYTDLPQTRGPIAIILCSSWKKVQAIYDFFQQFLSHAKVKIVTLFADGKSNVAKRAALMNGCEVLVSVPYCLRYFLEDNLICLKRCCHFILDDGNNLLSHHMKEVKEVMVHFTSQLKLRSSISLTLQTVICSERWTKRVESFVDKFMNSPLLFFTSFLEAAIYAHVPLFAHVCEEEDKERTLLGILESTGRTVISTMNADKASRIHNALKCEDVRSFLINEEMEHYISNGVIQDWKSIKSTAVPHCLVVTDSALTHLNISNANYLIHYDLPEVSRLQFGNRFGCIAEHFTKRDDIPNCVSHIFISKDNQKQAISLLEIMKRSKSEVKQELVDLAKMETNINKCTDAPLCHYMKAFGRCQFSACQKRHEIVESSDKPAFFACEGDIQALVTHVFDATHFCVRLLKYLLPTEKQVSMDGAYAKIGFQLKKIYSVEANRQKVELPVIGGTYVFQDENDLFYRIKVLDIKKIDHSQRIAIKIIFRDEGWLRSYENFNLFECKHVDDALPPPLAVEVYLCGVKTPDSCMDWIPVANRFIENLIINKEIHGKIVLCLGETLWLHPMAIRERLAYINDYVNVMTLEKALLDAGYANKNKEHLPLLFKACENKISLPKTKIIPKPTVVDIEPQTSYAFLDLNTFEDVYVSSIVSPHHMYVQRSKFVECLDELLDKINDQVNAKLLKQHKALLNGVHCIAPFKEDKRYYRAVVTDIVSDDVVQVFFVDFGDSDCVKKDCTFELPLEFSLLPFQAIECELHGIAAPHGGWTDKAADKLHELTRDDAGDMTVLTLKAYTKSSSYAGGNHYVVDLWGCEKSLSELLLEAGLVSQAEKLPVSVCLNETRDEDDLFDGIPPGYADSSDDDRDEEDKDMDCRFVLALCKLMYGEHYPPGTTPNLRNADIERESRPELSQSEGSQYIETQSSPQNKDVAEEGKNLNSPNNLKSVRELETIEITPTRSPFQAMQRYLNFSKKTNEPKRAKPFITWWDTVDKVYLTIHLKDIQIYELDVQDNGFTFTSALREVDYHVTETFHSSVSSNEFISHNVSEGLSIILKKQVQAKWPYLTQDAKKVPHIKFDLQHIEDSDIEDSTRLEDEIPTVSYTSDEEDSDDEEKHVEPWRKLAEERDKHDIFS